jgi:heat-inducible transcriptional repressor
MDLSGRVLKVLCAIVELYIRSGGAVASRDVARFSGLGLSAATMRNLMAELEEAGYLTRPHASAGTVPSDRSLRIYVDTVLNGRRLSPTCRDRLAGRMAAMKRELVEDFGWVARFTADVTGEAGVAVRPFGHGRVLEAVSLVPLDGGRVLGLLVTADGAVEKRLLALDAERFRDRYQEIANSLTESYRGLDVEEVVAEVESALDAPFTGDGPIPDRETLEIAHLLLSETDDRVEVRVAGTDNLIQTDDFSEIERVRSLLATLDDERRIVREIRRALSSRPTQAIIGRESDVTASGELGIVTTLFFRGGRRAGAVGVVGPRRMDYARIVPMVEYIGDSLTRMLQEPGAMNG